MQALTKILAILAMVAWGQSMFAAANLYKTATYVDQEYWILDGDGIKDLSMAPWVGVDKSISGTFDVSVGATPNELYDKVGYDPQKEVITAVEVLFAVGGELIEISLGGGDLGAAYVNQGSLDGLLDDDQYIHEFTETGITGSLLLTLVDTGQLDWSLSIGAGEQAVPLYAVSLAVQTRLKFYAEGLDRSDPIPVAPSVPLTPLDPVDPFDGSVPFGPVDPYDPSVPSTPLGPADPSDPLDPLDLFFPSGPSVPLDPFIPPTPSDPFVQPTSIVPPVPTSVPDSGATIVLFGACLIGLLSLRRRFAL